MFNPLQKTAPSVPYTETPEAQLSQLYMPLRKTPKTLDEPVDYTKETTQFLYKRLRDAAIRGKERECRDLAEVLVKERGEKPNLRLYTALILSNISHDEGAAWRVHELLDDMAEDGLQPDVGTCHAVLKVVAVHSDHLLRSDILDYMSKRWYQLSEGGAHDVTAGLLREGLLEQGLQRLDLMQQEGLRTQGWLLDMAVYVLSEAGEIAAAYRIMRQRFDGGEMQISRSLWWFFLDKASSGRHHAATALAWSSQVNQSYINPSSGTCLDVLATAAQAGDAVVATEVFTHLSKRGEAFNPIHYELLISTYLSVSLPDLNRALSILTIMSLEKVEPSTAETRALYLHLCDQPALLPEALHTLRDLHSQGRKIPIAALNLLIECYVEQRNLSEALNIYKQIHTFVPIAEGAKKTFANIETFNLLLRGCSRADPPDEHQASFLVSELLALRVKPTALTFDRLILVFVKASSRLAESETNKSQQLLDWAFRHFTDMQALGWMPRFGTIESLATSLARAGDGRCWDLLQAAKDQGENIETWSVKGVRAKRNVEQIWESVHGVGGGDGVGEEDERSLADVMAASHGGEKEVARAL